MDYTIFCRFREVKESAIARGGMLGSESRGKAMAEPQERIVLEVSAYMTRNVTTLRNDSHLLDAALMIRRSWFASWRKLWPSDLVR